MRFTVIGSWGKKLLAGRYGAVCLFIGLFLYVQFLTRVVLFLKASSNLDFSALSILAIFAVGLLLDFATSFYFALPLVLYLSIVPSRFARTRLNLALLSAGFFLSIFLFYFTAVAEYFFWDEFGVRFNFIAVDYLVYTTEVLGNIRESYPLPLVFGGLFLITGATFLILWKSNLLRACVEHDHWKRTPFIYPLIALPILVALFLTSDKLPRFANNFNQELSHNGPYSFFAAFWSNELDYEKFYPTRPVADVFSRVRSLVKEKNSAFIANPLGIQRFVTNSGPEKNYNVIQVTVESLSASFLGCFGNTQKLTPNLDKLAAEGMLFTRLYATGNRTDRGMEALTLSVPPTPGRSLVKRPHNENLFSLGSVFRSKGCETKFIYSGYGYFDNMNYFFGNNGYKVIDRASVPKDQITFANAWGACDEDLFDWVIKEADASYAAKKPFFDFVMTTSNHRPFTYPEGRIDIPSHTGRFGAVKYTDYAIGKLIEKSQSKPWFSNTLFVIVADHCGDSAGKTSLPPSKYEIPMIIYNPSFIKPAKVDKLCSQVDYPPTLLSLLGWSYKSQFYGKDVLSMEHTDERALIGNYQQLGYLKENRLTVLKPVKQMAACNYERASGETTSAKPTDSDIEDTISFYQSAGYIFKHHLNRALHE